MSHPSYHPGKLVGPPAVRSWTQMDVRRDASKCVLDRKLDSVRTRHRDLAEAQALLDEVSALPKAGRHPNAIENLTKRRDNKKEWLDHTIALLKEHLEFTVARHDGRLDALRPLKGGKKRGKLKHNRKKVKESQELVAFYRDALDEFLLAAAASAGNWIRLKCKADKHGYGCAEYRSGKTTAKFNNKTITACKHVIAELNRKPVKGHSGTNEATTRLIAHAAPVIECHKRKSGREIEVAEQLAWIEVVETAARFDLSEGRKAHFNTFYTYRCRRATQIRSANDCPPGKTRIKGKIIARGTLHVHDDESSGDLFHPVVMDDENKSELKEAVTRALATLTPEEQQIASVHMIDDVSLRKLAAERGESLHQVRKMVKQVREKLQGLLKDFAT